MVSFHAVSDWCLRDDKGLWGGGGGAKIQKKGGGKTLTLTLRHVQYVQRDILAARVDSPNSFVGVGGGLLVFCRPCNILFVRIAF